MKMSHEANNETAVTTAGFAKSIEPLLFSMQETIKSQNKLTQRPDQREIGRFFVAFLL